MNTYQNGYPAAQAYGRRAIRWTDGRQDVAGPCMRLYLTIGHAIVVAYISILKCTGRRQCIIHVRRRCLL